MVIELTEEQTERLLNLVEKGIYYDYENTEITTPIKVKEDRFFFGSIITIVEKALNEGNKKVTVLITIEE